MHNGTPWPLPYGVGDSHVTQDSLRLIRERGLGHAVHLEDLFPKARKVASLVGLGIGSDIAGDIGHQDKRGSCCRTF